MSDPIPKIHKRVPFGVMRHGDTAVDLTGKSQGLRQTGLLHASRKDIRQEAEKLKGKIDCIIASDTQRCEQTAKIISRVTRVPIVEVSALLRPWNYGDLVGKSEDSILEALNTVFIPNPDTPIPGGECFNDFKERFLDIVRNLLAAYQGKTVLIVTHSCNERLLRAWDKAGQFQNDFDPSEVKKKGIKSGEWEFLGPKPLVPQVARKHNEI